VGTAVGSPCNNAVGMAVHQPALYDFVSAIFLLLVLLRLRRTVRYDGFLTLVFGAWYGTGRVMEDFFRVDVTHGTGLTGSQWTALTVLGLCLFCLVVLKDTPWKSGKGAFASVPVRHGGPAPGAEPPVPEIPDEETKVDADQPVEDGD
jgi:prolipoprotein diacylglyceryltransferase